MSPRAQSLATGFYFPKSVSDEMAKRKFASNLWVSEKELARNGFPLLTKHIGNYVPVKINTVEDRMYNVCQTTRARILHKLAGRLVPRRLFSDEPLSQSASRRLSANIFSYPKNEWLSEAQLNTLGMKPRKNATAVITEEPSEKSPGEITFYNVAQLQSPDVIERMKKILPISCGTGRFYRMPEALRILKFAIDAKYDSPFWLTQSLADELNVQIKKSSTPVVLSVDESDAQLTLYNSCQTNSPKIVTAHALAQQFCPRCGISGRRFPKLIEDVLSAASFRKKFDSVLWLTEGHLAAISAELLPGQTPTIVDCGSGKMVFYNAAQTKSLGGSGQRWHR